MREKIRMDDSHPPKISKKKCKRQEYQRMMFEKTGMSKTERRQHKRRENKIAKMNPEKVNDYIRVYRLSQEFYKMMSPYKEIPYKYRKNVARHLANHVVGVDDGSAWGYEDDIGMVGERIFATHGICPTCGSKLEHSNNSTPLGDFWCSTCQHYIELKTTTHERPLLVFKIMNMQLMRVLSKIPALLERLKCRWLIIAYLDRENGILRVTKCFDIRHIITIIGENQSIIEMIDNGDFSKCLLEFDVDGDDEILTFNFV